ncbi:MAG TPA: GntR family transcriptional regulator [Candidatus Yaniella excrementigallinarum]|nr:GntR family transcriptional regulator [Candidatus Yaniella excrementigallinarum]
MSLQPLDLKSRVADQVYDAIYNAIMSGEFEAGRRLQIRDLATELGTSVMPVREAITRLEQAGIVETGPYRGAVVKGFSSEELHNIYQVRKLLEADAAQKGVEGHSPDVIPKLEDLHLHMRQQLEAHDYVGYLDGNDAFLTELYTGANNPVLLELIGNLWNRGRHIKLVGVKNQMAGGAMEPLIRFQRQLIDAVIANDPQAAANVTYRSLDAALERIQGRLTEPSPDN